MDQDVLEGRRILVVEDEFLIALSLRSQFESLGAHVAVAASVAEGLAQADDAHDAAVLDVRLPDGDVFPVAEALARRGVPLVFHSGHADGNELERSFPGAMALSKPACQVALAASVRAVIDAPRGAAQAPGTSGGSASPRS
ncbi:response regulator [Jannaschia sp. W003]|uniref:response regulator n=1 Tax=Jannaschia sp. W003 TaxID=2867012 RepID=UPI0021A68DEA|nr:response regulator [Jannaschia sp. W003]UWQ21143.1 response regulator [Jannaschia sp. W003]